MKLNHIAIIASNYERSLRFYQGLGFKETERIYRPNDVMGMLECDGMVIELFEKDAPERLTNPEALGLRHIAFTIPDIDEQIKVLSVHGIAIEPVRADQHGKRFTFFKDPDGLPIEIKEE